MKKINSSKKIAEFTIINLILSKKVYTLYKPNEYFMITKVRKWGNSLGLRLPKSMIQELNLADGSEISISEENGKIIIEPEIKDLSLKELIEGMSVEGIKEQFVEVKPIGKEIIWNEND